MPNTASSCYHAHPTTIAVLQPVTRSARPLNDSLWALLTKAGPLTAAEWAFVEEHERAEQALEAGRNG